MDSILQKSRWSLKSETIRWDIGGDEQRIHHKTYGHTFKYILLPVWMASAQGQDFPIPVNARTGRCRENGVGWIKITLAVLAALAVIGTIIYFANEK